MATKQGSIGVTTENIFPVIKKFLYSDHEIFLRELVSNAVDATQKLRTLASFGDFKGEVGDAKVTVKIDTEAGTLTVSDHGIGMTADDVDKYINQIAFSGAEEFLSKYKDTANSIIGHFGLGFYSAFMVAKKVVIDSLSYKEGAEAVRWECDGSPAYTMDKGSRTERGTDIILYIDDDDKQFLEQSRINLLLKKYCRFLPVPVETDGNVVNSTEPLWTRKPADLTDEDYRNFYRELYPGQEDPLFWIHLNVDYPFTLTGILFFPKIKNNLDIRKDRIQLYCNQVYVTDSVEGVVPEFMMLLQGVIDSPDIPLNVSRSYLQSDSNVKKISGYITRKVADRLSELFTQHRDEFEKKWDDLKIFIEYGIITDEKFAEKAADFTLVKNTDGKYFTLAEYNALVKENQTDRHGNVVCLYTTDPVTQNAFVEAARGKGYDVLTMDGQLDGHFISWFENKNAGTRFVRVDADVVERLIDKESDLKMALSTAQQDLLRPVFESQLPPEEKVRYTVAFEPMDESRPPVVITQNEFMRRMKDMAAMGGGGMQFYGQMPDNFNVVVNGNHPLVAEILGEVEKSYGDRLKTMNKKLDAALSEQNAIEEKLKDKKPDQLTDEEKKSREESSAKVDKLRGERTARLTEIGKENKLVKQVIDLALLSNGMLKGENLTNFIRRSIELIEK